MILKQCQIAARLSSKHEKSATDPFFIVPRPFSEDEIEYARTNPDSPLGSGSVDVRLGTWFLVSRSTKVSVLEVTEPSRVSLKLRRLHRKNLIQGNIDQIKSHLESDFSAERSARSYHIRFGDDFVLHPRAFALASTLEWFRIPTDLAGYVTGRSSWGRRGLIIATAVGVHPGFTGTLTLELSNLGDVPVIIRPGMTIGQLFLHTIDQPIGNMSIDNSSFSCRRRPTLGEPHEDEIARKLAEGYD